MVNCRAYVVVPDSKVLFKVCVAYDAVMTLHSLRQSLMMIALAVMGLYWKFFYSLMLLHIFALSPDLQGDPMQNTLRFREPASSRPWLKS